MRAIARSIALWSVTLSLLAGLWMPFAARVDEVDGDGVCGPELVASGSPAKFDLAKSAPLRGHCLFCHLRHDLAGAFVSAFIQIALPGDVGQTVTGRPMAAPGEISIGHTAPRGPPAIS